MSADQLDSRASLSIAESIRVKEIARSKLPAWSMQLLAPSKQSAT